MCAKSVASRVLVTALLMLAQLGGSLRPNPALDQLNRSVQKPLPALPPAPAPRSDQIWVPDRYFPSPAGGPILVPGFPAGGPIFVPGHWERQINSQEYYAPSLPVCTGTGQCVTTPAGTRPQAPDNRQSP